MSLFISSLNSGSNGNCYYIGNETEAVLIDAGISCREIEKRIKRLGLSMQKIKAVFVSHEHSDHIKGVCGIIKKYRIPVYITNSTFTACRFSIEASLIKTFNPFEPVVIGGLAITGFPKMHDACDPYSFVVGCNEITAGVFTDIGTPCKNLINHFKQCHAAFLEANYDDEMLTNGSYPYHLKKRIKGGSGHLSNTQALDLFITHKPAFMSHLLLSHLSQNNNCSAIVQRLFDGHADGVKIIVTSRFEESAVYQIKAENHIGRKYKAASYSSTQMAFSFT